MIKQDFNNIAKKYNDITNNNFLVSEMCISAYIPHRKRKLIKKINLK